MNNFSFMKRSLKVYRIIIAVVIVLLVLCSCRVYDSKSGKNQAPAISDANTVNQEQLAPTTIPTQETTDDVIGATANLYDLYRPIFDEYMTLQQGGFEAYDIDRYGSSLLYLANVSLGDDSDRFPTIMYAFFDINGAFL